MTFFFQEMPVIVRRGALYLAQPPFYRLASGDLRLLMPTTRIELSSIKPPSRAKGPRSAGSGLGEMNPLRETTMDRTRSLIVTPHEYEGARRG